MASYGEDGAVVWWDVIDGFPVATKGDADTPKKPDGFYGKVENRVLECCFGPASELATCACDRTVKLWNAEGKETKTFSLPDDAPAGGPPPRVRVIPTRVAISADVATVMAGDSAGQLHSRPTK